MIDHLPQSAVKAVLNYDSKKDVLRTEELGTKDEFKELEPRVSSYQQMLRYSLQIAEKVDDLDSMTATMLLDHITIFEDILRTIKSFGNSSLSRLNVISQVNSALESAENGKNSLKPVHALVSTIGRFENRSKGIEEAEVKLREKQLEVDKLITRLKVYQENASETSKKLQDYSVRAVGAGYQTVYEEERRRYGLLHISENGKWKLGVSFGWLLASIAIAVFMSCYIWSFISEDYLVRIGNLFAQGTLPTSGGEESNVVIPEDSRPTVFVIFALTRLAILSFFTFLLTMTIKQFNVSMHRSSTNAAKSNALQSLDVFLESIGQEESQVRFQIIGAVSNAIYSKDTSGYIQEQKNDQPNLLFDPKILIDKQQEVNS